MFHVNDILEVVKKPIGVALYPEMFVRVTEVRVRQKYMHHTIGGSIADPLATVTCEYDTEVDVEYPVRNPVFIDGVEFRKSTGIDASVFKLAAVDSESFRRLEEEYAKCNYKILSKHDSIQVALSKTDSGIHQPTCKIQSYSTTPSYTFPASSVTISNYSSDCASYASISNSIADYSMDAIVENAMKNILRKESENMNIADRFNYPDYKLRDELRRRGFEVFAKKRND